MVNNQQNINDLSPNQGEKKLQTISIWVLGIGLGMIFLYPMGIEENAVNIRWWIKILLWIQCWLKYFSVSVLLAGTSLFIGGLFGFLFGIPSISQDSDNLEKNKNQDPSSTVSKLLINGNVRQISDWLTKILVGVGLTQFSSVPSKLEKLSISQKNELL